MIFLMVLLCGEMGAQTYYYKYFSKEDLTTGIKERPSGSLYITFRNGKSEFVQTDASGEALSESRRDTHFGYVSTSLAPKMVPARYAVFPGQTQVVFPKEQCEGVFSRDGWSGDMRRYSCYHYTYYSSYNVYSMQFEEIVLDKGWYYLYVSEDYSEIYIKEKDTLTTLRKAESQEERSASHMW